MRKKLAIAGVLLAAGAAAYQSPWFDANRYKARIQTALESSLNRRVEITGNLSFSLLTGLGFSIANVVIHEDPAIGIEPFAYVVSLDARLNPLSLLRGRWEVSSILLDEPTVNLVKHTSGSWNVRPLLARTGPLRSLPEIHVRTGRVNLKFGDTKSVLYYREADIDLTPRDGEVRIRFTGEPARTDRIAQGFGTLEGRGTYRWFAEKAGELELNVDLERSALADVAMLLEGHGTAVSGFFATRARVSGPLSGLKIEGSARLEDIQEFALLSAGGGSGSVKYSGQFDLPAGELDLITRSEGQPAPFRLRLRAHSLLENPRWGAILQVRELPVGALQEALQYMKIPLPDRASLEGKLSGVLGYSPAHGLQGVLQMPVATVEAAGATARLIGAEFSVEREKLSLKPARLELADGHLVEIEGAFSANGHSFTWRTSDRPLPVALLLASHRQLFGAAEVPLLDRLKGGEVRGTLRYERAGDAAAVWDGRFSLRNAQIQLDGVADPVKIQTAAAAIREQRILLEGVTATVGRLSVRGSYRMERGPRPHRLAIQIGEAEVAEIERLLLPALSRDQGFLARTLRFRPSAAPGWLRERHLDAALKIDSLYADETWLGGISGRALWDGVQISIPNLKWQRDDASGGGKLTIALSGPEPQYLFQGEMKNLSWKGGTVDGDGTIETRGVGLSLLRNARSSGRFLGRGLELAPEGGFRALSGTFEFSVPRAGPLLRLANLEAAIGPEMFTGQGRSADGKLLVDLTSGQKSLRMAGTLWPFDLEAAPR